jgi:ubiquinone/menaquinone biosynthesis C-methylase UbiE
MTADDEAARWRARGNAIVDVARSLTKAGPSPRARPFFDLDHRSGTPLVAVEDLATRGIFRKYEHVLDLGGGLGATTRYLTSRLGCTGTATTASSAEATTARMLTARAGLDWQVFHVAGDAARLPFAEAAFTHVWIVDVLPGLGPSAAVLAEAFRVLRPGGHLGVQDLSLRHDDESFAARGFVHERVRESELAHAGFLEVVLRRVDVASAPERTAWERLAAKLGADDALVRDRVALQAGITRGALALVQLTARRP